MRNGHGMRNNVSLDLVKGFGKSELMVMAGETPHMDHFNGHGPGPAQRVQALYELHRAASEKDAHGRLTALTVLKNPGDLVHQETLARYAQYFPRTDFIICLRHPVTWFESLFNYKQRLGYPQVLKRRASDLIGGECSEPVRRYQPLGQWGEHRGSHELCTFFANFHFYLSRLGKTPMNTDAEMALLQHNMSIDPMPNRVFLQELRQISYRHPSGSNYTVDLQHFLGLSVPLTSTLEHKKTPDHVNQRAKDQANEHPARAHEIDICAKEHDAVRKELVQSGRDASTWIVDYLLGSPDVVVSNRPEFVKLMKTWAVDPCSQRLGFVESLPQYAIGVDSVP